VPELRYVEVDPARLDRLRSNLNNWWGDQIPIALCVRCGLRYTEDSNRDPAGEPIHEDPEDDLDVVCDECRSAALSEALQGEMLLVLEEKLGLAERHREARKSFIETIFTDPKKILQVQDLDNRVRSLQTQVNVLWAVVGGAIITLFVLVVTMIATRQA
jgi:hypothetical protein